MHNVSRTKNFIFCLSALRSCEEIVYRLWGKVQVAKTNDRLANYILFMPISLIRVDPRLYLVKSEDDEL